MIKKKRSKNFKKNNKILKQKKKRLKEVNQDLNLDNLMFFQRS